MLEVGDHVFEAHASGYLSERRTISIAGGEQTKLEIVMHRLELAESSEPGSRAPLRRDDSHGRRNRHRHRRARGTR